MFYCIKRRSIAFTSSITLALVLFMSCIAVQPIEKPNSPIGTAKGIHPGRVVWTHNPAATNEHCTNQYGEQGIREDDDGYWMAKNTNQSAVDQMLGEILINLTGEKTNRKAWERLFGFFNADRHGENRGYRTGEKIFIKTNATSAFMCDKPWGNCDSCFNVAENCSYGCNETTPQVVLALLKQLVYEAGVAQECIYIGDPMRSMYNHCLNTWHAAFPAVHYLDLYGAPGNGREKTLYTDSVVIRYSDRGKVLRDDEKHQPHTGDALCAQMYAADYLIDVPVLKAHESSGISVAAKNFFGTINSQFAGNLHQGLLDPHKLTGWPARGGYRQYRVLVDLAGHERLGRNTMLFLVDALYGSGSSLAPPDKWITAPFGNDWTSSLIASQDMVALESVCFDLLKNEYTKENHPQVLCPNYGKVEPCRHTAFPFLSGTDDHLHQAADSAWWPKGIVYDPEGDGTPIPSIGVHEHWNNPTDMKYSRDLKTGNGIELVRLSSSTRTPTVPIARAMAAPRIDADTQDACWKDTLWRAIDQSWIPYGIPLAPGDACGRFKVVWTPDKLYIVAEIDDDTLVAGNPQPTEHYPDYDCLEVFVDEDNSGGVRTYNHNAFAYHISPEGHAIDMDGQTPKLFDSNVQSAFARNGARNIFECAIDIYEDTFVYGKSKQHPVTLKAGKVMGFSVAYCDNDSPGEEPKTRDTFMGSVWISPADANRSWEDASIFGKVVLAE